MYVRKVRARNLTACQTYAVQNNLNCIQCTTVLEYYSFTVAALSDECGLYTTVTVGHEVAITS